MVKYKKIMQKQKIETISSYKKWQIELLDESCSISDIQDYFEYILKRHEEKNNNPSVRIHVK